MGNPYEAGCHVSVHTGHFRILLEKTCDYCGRGSIFYLYQYYSGDFSGQCTVFGKRFVFFQYKKIDQPCCIQSGVREIGYSEFSSCSCLTTVIIENGSEKIGEEAFNYCDNLKVLQPPQSLKEIGSNAFYRCIVLETVRLPDGLTRIGS